MDFNPREMPPIHDSTFLELTPEERRMLAGRGPTKGQLQHVFSHPAFRYFVARLKKTANQKSSEFFAGVGIPNGVEAASNREAYFIALVNSLRGVLNSQRELWDEAMLREGTAAEKAPVPAAEPEGDMFSDKALTTYTTPGDE